MKRIIPILSLLLALMLLCGCAASDPDPVETDPTESTPPPASEEPTTEATTEATTEPEPTETDPPETTVPVVIPEVYPDVVGFYIPAGNGSRDRVFVTEFSAPRVAAQDIDCFEVFASQDEVIPGASFATMWKNVWESHENTEGAKIGFHIEFTLDSGEVISQTLLKPSDAQSFFEYLEIYMYDDVHVSGGWYSHLEDDQMTEETIISSIKLHGGKRIDEVGDIVFTVFIYNGEDCFDTEGNYIGTVSQTIVITE